MIRTTRLRRMILQFRHSFFTEACTLIFPSPLTTAAAWAVYFARNTIRPRLRS